MTPVIRAEGLSKVYQLGQTRPGWWRHARVSSVRKPSGTISPPLDSEIWALRDIDLQIMAGEAVGIIGNNGAGKSTLLKILSRITVPTMGRARVVGRLGTILEVGTGFHPELTGMENIYLSGAILGMRKAEVDAKFDEIVAFAGVEQFVDTPVKRYSSGMYVRLAFAVAAHLEPDILIVDEVLAVGDVGFQKRCLRKMDKESSRKGRTILFVSHNLQAIRALCSRAILLDHGRVIADGPVQDVLSRYSAVQTTHLDVKERALGDRLNRTAGHARFTGVEIFGASGKDQWTFQPGETVGFRFDYEVVEAVETLGFILNFYSIVDGDVITNVKEVFSEVPVRAGQRGHLVVRLPNNRFRPGELILTACLGNYDFSVFEDVLDGNVGLPHLIIESEEEDWYKRSGYFSIDYSFEHQS